MKNITILFLILGIIVQQSLAYGPATSLHMAYYSSIAYESQAAISSWNCGACSKYPTTDIKVFSNSVSGMQGYTGYSHSLNAIVVVLRGSSNIQNWILNIGTNKVTYSLCSGCNVHAGFMTAYNSVGATIKTNVNNLKAKYGSAKLMVTGHSLGGAVAILAAADLHQLHAVYQVFTFGQPRVGDTAFADWFARTIPGTFRVIHYADIVPHLPPSSFGFLHGSTQIWYQRGMQTYSTCTAQSANCANSIGTTGYSTGDHDIANYLKMKVGQNQIQEQKIIDNQENNDWKIQEQRKVQAFFKSLINKRQNLKFQE